MRRLPATSQRTLPQFCAHGTSSNAIHLPSPFACGRRILSFRRNLSFSSIDPVTISRDRQEVTFRLKDGNVVTQRIAPTPKVKKEKLEEALSSLLSSPESDSTKTGPWYGTVDWELDPLGDAIHRHAAVSSYNECDEIERLIMARAEEMGHHPHIARLQDRDGPIYMTITCTTHSPRGLSGRDVRLAAKINEVLSNFRTTAPLNADVQDHPTQEQIMELRRRAIEDNREKISEALESCGCETAKS
ncbi:hypothetical protein EDD37DRAFT_256982 [Exophiala viscosa]|uniref:4a-hydroxytetrahydrobiopterin dehydratase n=1 Tax=Exophiala viscosa TaxID=2486360 RepID=A0AAN6E6U0_9EURO|nr:hypothetical protein EDD36DRAFT_22883 [Exophiala viscosa]KAI1627266.1 hypothetical protein EDD37DRAFT_256982 [Exophiala viscosa]